MADHANEVQSYTPAPTDADSASVDIIRFLTSEAASPVIQNEYPTGAVRSDTVVSFTAQVEIT